MNKEDYLLEYNDHLVLYFLFKQDKSRNNTEISTETGIYYQTVIDRVKNLESYQLIGTIMRGNNKLARITEKGRDYLEKWLQNPLGKELKAEFEETLQKPKKKS